MNKLEEIKKRMGATNVLMNWGFFHETEKAVYEDVRYLLSIIEEKDKALEQFANEYNWIDIWDPGLESCKKEWAPIENPIEIANKALRGE